MIVADKLHRTILLQLELITFRFAYGRDRNQTCSWFLIVWTRWKSLFMDLNITITLEIKKTKNGDTFRTSCFHKSRTFRFKRFPHVLRIFVKYSGIWKSINKGSPGVKNPEIIEFLDLGLSNNKTEILLNQNEAEQFSGAI